MGGEIDRAIYLGIVNSGLVSVLSYVNDCGNTRNADVRRKADGQWTTRLVDRPGDAVDAAHGWVGEFVEGGGRKIEIAIGACRTPVSQRDLNGRALVWSGRG